VENNSYTVNKIRYKVATNSTIIHLPATAEENASLDAINAYNAADSANQAAHVASHVAEHAADVRFNAETALGKARDALHEARTSTAGLKVEQKDALRRAEKTLSRATDAAEIKHANHRSAEREALEVKLGKVAQAGSVDSGNELAQMRAEIEQLRRELKKSRSKAKVADAKRKMDASEKDLAELEVMIKDLEASEQHQKVKPSEHDEMKAEVERLRERVKSLEGDGAAADTGSLHYEIPPKRELPLRTVASGADFESPVSLERAPSSAASSADEPCDDASSGIDIDTQMPYGELEPFGREDTAQELTENSVKESDEMVDQIERSQVAEEKRAVFRALTRLRGAAITSFDGIARSLTANVDEYNKLHHWRKTHPLHHLANEESDITKWAFPDNADF